MVTDARAIEIYAQLDAEKLARKTVRDKQIYNYTVDLINGLRALFASRFEVRPPTRYQWIEITRTEKYVGLFLTSVKNTSYYMMPDGRIMELRPTIWKKVKVKDDQGKVTGEEEIVDERGCLTEVNISTVIESIPEFPDLDFIQGIYGALSSTIMFDNFGLVKDYDRWCLTLDQFEARRREAAARSIPQPELSRLDKFKKNARKGWRNFMNYD